MKSTEKNQIVLRVSQWLRSPSYERARRDVSSTSERNWSDLCRWSVSELFHNEPKEGQQPTPSEQVHGHVCTLLCRLLPPSVCFSEERSWHGEVWCSWQGRECLCAGDLWPRQPILLSWCMKFWQSSKSNDSLHFHHSARSYTITRSIPDTCTLTLAERSKWLSLGSLPEGEREGLSPRARAERSKCLAVRSLLEGEREGSSLRARAERFKSLALRSLHEGCKKG